MLCARCGTHEGIKEYNDMLLCEYCYNIAQTTDAIVKIACADGYYHSDRFRIEKLVESIFNAGYSQCIKDDYSI